MAIGKSIIIFFAICLIYGTLAVPHHTVDHANHCHADGGEVGGLIHIEVGQSSSLPGKCQKVTCQKDFTLASVTCPVAVPKDGCKFSDIDYKKPYPDCCPQEICEAKH